MSSFRWLSIMLGLLTGILFKGLYRFRVQALFASLLFLSTISSFVGLIISLKGVSFMAKVNLVVVLAMSLCVLKLVWISIQLLINNVSGRCFLRQGILLNLGFLIWHLFLIFSTELNDSLEVGGRLNLLIAVNFFLLNSLMLLNTRKGN